jgi:hypothetical protein
VRKEPGMVIGSLAGVLEHVDFGQSDIQPSRPCRRAFDSACRFYPNVILSDRYRRYGKLVRPEGGAIDAAAFAGDEDIGIQNQAPAHGSLP